MKRLASFWSMPICCDEPEGREAVDDAEVDGLGAAAVLGVDFAGGHAEDLRGGEGVDVVAAAVGLDQQRVGGEVGEQAQLDLRVVGGEQQVAGLGDEGGANLAAQLGADGDVLQVGIDGREASGGRAGHVEGGVQAAGARVEQRGQRVDVSRFELGELAVLEHQARDVVLGGEAFEHIDGGGDGLALAVLHGLGQVELVEEHVAELLGRVDVELGAALLPDVAGLLAGVALEALRHFGEDFGVDLDAGGFHARQHGRHGEIDVVVNLR